ncbi:hypothetical protein [Kitasatospora griseola]|uniref:hypothetical protein n=1 Tax=Kitasatospora griseola TaxID=2064 RepID=UPI00380982FB
MGATNDQLAGFIFLIGLVGFGSAYWNKTAPEREAAESWRRDQLLRARKDQLEQEMRSWHHGSVKAWEDKQKYRPAPAGSPHVGGRSDRIDLRPVVLRSGQEIALPDAAQARQVLSSTVTDLVGVLSDEARRYTHLLGTLPGEGRERGEFRKSGGPLGWHEPESGSRLTSAAAELAQQILAWAGARRTLLEAFPPLGDALTAVKAAAFEIDWRLAHPGWDIAYRGAKQLPVLPGEQWLPLLTSLKGALSEAAVWLDTMPPFKPAGPLHPPRDARFTANVSPSAADERLTAFLLERTSRFAALATGRASAQPPDWDLGESLLDGFLTTEVARRFQRVTEGARNVADLSADATTADIRHRLHLAYLALSLNYLMEVSNQMPEYAERSGMGEPRPPVTINGNVGQVNIADTIRFIGANVAAIMARGDDRSAAAIDALTAAIQQEHALPEPQRADLLNGVADISDAAADPSDHRLRTRARNALAAITQAGAVLGATSPIAQAITDWQHVYTNMF